MEFSDLVLLIGTNPLPNYVVAKYFINNGINGYPVKCIWLVHSSKTKNQFLNLYKILLEEFKIEVKAVNLEDESDAFSIREDINSQILDNFNSSHIHLNYTGGTKAMGIHVYRSIEKRLSPEQCCSFSYLSASKFQLTEDNKRFLTGDLRMDISLDLNTLFALHGFKKVSPNSSFEPDAFKNSTDVLREIIENGNFDTFWKEVSQTSDKKFVDALCKLSKNYHQQRKLSLDDSKTFQIQSPLLQRIVSLLPEKILNSSGQLKVETTESKFIECIEYIAKNKWFEDYVFQILRKNFGTRLFIEIDKNWEFAGKDWGKNRFELDVLMLIGYQFVGISCTRLSKEKECQGQGGKSLLKSKGFEVIHRTRQIGGDEARAVLVTMAEPQLVQTIEKELQLETGNTANILVLGKRDLKEAIMIRKIKKFIGLKD